MPPTTPFICIKFTPLYPLITHVCRLCFSPFPPSPPLPRRSSTAAAGMIPTLPTPAAATRAASQASNLASFYLKIRPGTAATNDIDSSLDLKIWSSSSMAASVSTLRRCTWMSRQRARSPATRLRIGLRISCS